MSAQKDDKGLSKIDLKKLKRKEKVAKHAIGDFGKDPASLDHSEGASQLYGDYPMIQSTLPSKSFKNLASLNEDLVGFKIWIRVRVHKVRVLGKSCFLVLRQQMETIQAIIFQGASVPKGMIKYAATLNPESVIDVLAEITVPGVQIQKTSIKNIELTVLEIHAISRAIELPFLVEDASRSETVASDLPTLNQNTVLNNRWIDLRTPANQAIFRIQSGVCQLFREFLIEHKFIEIHTPKLLSYGSTTQSDINVFKFKYFNQNGFLAQSPQHYKQISVACCGFDRVFEIGPLFRAEHGNTHRHLCEFTGIDFEMVIFEHYDEVIDVSRNLSSLLISSQLTVEMFRHLLDGIRDRYQHELVVVSQQYPFEPLKYQQSILRITFAEGIALLQVSLSHFELPHITSLGGWSECFTE
jgi:aspartyl-tRNA synthetase